MFSFDKYQQIQIGLMSGEIKIEFQVCHFEKVQATK